MKALLKLYSTEEKASDGSSIGRAVTEEYLAGDDYKKVIEDKIGLGGVTHKDRKVDPKYKGLIGNDDQLLISNNATHYFTKIFMNPGDPVVYGEIQLFDPSLFAGERRDNILNLESTLRSGVKLPVSIVIHALWNPDNSAKKIRRIKGVDFTQNNAFPTAGTVKLMSCLESACERTFSDVDGSEVHEIIKTFSAETVSVEEDKAPIDDTELIRRYGRNSTEYKKSHKLMIHEEAGLQKSADADLTEVHDVLKELLGDNEELTKKLLTKSKDRLIKILNSIPVTATDRDRLLRVELDKFLKEYPEDKQFTNTSIIVDRLRYKQYPRVAFFRKLLKSYKDFYKSAEIKFKSDKIERTNFFDLVVSDLRFLMTSVEKEIMDGRTLTHIYGLSEYEDIAEAATEFSRIYRKALLSEKVLSFIPKEIYKAYLIAISQFYSAVLSYIAGEAVKYELSSLERITT